MVRLLPRDNGKKLEIALHNASQRKETMSR